MLRFVMLVCLLGVAMGLPSRSMEEIDSFREFLLNTREGSEATFEENMQQRPWSSAWENSGKFQGDIVVTDEDIEDLVADFSGVSSRTAVMDRGRTWPGAWVPYEFAGHNGHEQDIIRGIMRMYEDHTCVRFRHRGGDHDHVRITNHGDGCYAHVGFYRNMGAHIHNLAPNGCMHGGIIFHEFGHNVGFQHMHQSRVRYDWVHINWGNIQGGAAGNFYLISEAYGDMLGLPYEYASNMHYGAHAFSHNGQPTIHALHPGGHEMGQMDYITGWDMLRIRRLYNCPGAWSEEVNMEDLNKPAVYIPNNEQLAVMGAEFAEVIERRSLMEQEAEV